MTSRATLLLLLPVLLTLPLVTACGYRVEGDRSQSALDGGALPLVAVEPFDLEKTYRRGIEVTLTRLVNDELRARTPRAAVSPEDADWILSGIVTRWDKRVLSEDSQDVVREAVALISVEVSLKEVASGEVIGTYTLTEHEPFSDRVGRIATFEQASLQAARDLAERIVYLLEARDPEDVS